MVSNGTKLLKVCFELSTIGLEKNDSIPVFDKTKMWLKEYFNGKNPHISIEIELSGSDFELEVWQIVQKIPYGKTATYGEIASVIAQKRGLYKMSAQAVGRAISKNPLAIIVPCHRVVAKNSIGGYFYNIDYKKKLLKLENPNLKIN